MVSPADNMMTYCPDGIELGDPFAQGSLSNCFLGTLTTCTLLLYIFIFSLVDLILTNTFRTGGQPFDNDPVDHKIPPFSRHIAFKIPSTALFLLIVFLGSLPALRLAIFTIFLKIDPLYGYMIFETAGTIFAWMACFVWFWSSAMATNGSRTGRGDTLWDGHRGYSYYYSSLARCTHYRSIFLCGFWLTAFVISFVEVADAIMKTAAEDAYGEALLTFALFKFGATLAILGFACVQSVVQNHFLNSHSGRYSVLADSDMKKWEYSLRPEMTELELDELCEMFHGVPCGCNRNVKFNIGKKYRNRPKNRYCNRLPYDDTRIVLRNCISNSREGGDYINASPILLSSALDQATDETCNRFRAAAYIATQGPLPCTIEDFWRMVYEQKSRLIIMLSNLQEGAIVKCEKYWPEPNAPLYLPQYSLVVAQTGCVRYLRAGGNSSDVAYVKRTFRLQDTDKGISLALVQYQYVTPEWRVAAEESMNLYENHVSSSGWNGTGWYSNNKFPTASQSPFTYSSAFLESSSSGGDEENRRELLSEYARFVLDAEASLASSVKAAIENNEQIGPTVVHCSAGTGRTGIQILVTECIRAIQRGVSVLRPFDILINMRRQRRGMIHTVEQFRFALEVVLEFMKSYYSELG